jgi:PRTRC genetic system ThiF family protein
MSPSTNSSAVTKRIKLLDNPNGITICVIGCGGTGSYVAYALARMNLALIAHNKPGIQLFLYDHDTVSLSNIGRQQFVNQSINSYKAVELATQINMQYGMQSEAFTEYIHDKIPSCNVLISCVDNNESRYNIYKLVNKTGLRVFNDDHNNARVLWIDYGNGLDYGQISFNLLNNSKIRINNFKKIWPKKAPKDTNEPSCSFADAISKQDIFINSVLAEIGIKALYDLILNKKWQRNNIFLNLKKLKITNS